MKKILVISIGLILVLMLTMSFVSAGFFGDFWAKITGKPTQPGLGDIAHPTPICNDFDGDGHESGACLGAFDCVDIDADCSDYPLTAYAYCINNKDLINPDATEVCGDGIDNDCDGQIDEVGCTVPCTDGDGDGYYIQSNGCDSEPGFLGYNDCNDNDNAIYPGAPELCDGFDNDCDIPTLIDEDFPSSFSSANLEIKQLNDACNSNSVIREYWCEQGQLQNDIYSCSSKVGADSFCYDGACIDCVDTDLPAFNGKNYTVSGSAFNLSNINNPAEDSCIDSTTLNESFCSTNNIIDFQDYDCTSFGNAYICEDGACFCEPEYVADMITCGSDDTVTFKDLSACDAPDYTAYYDCDGNGVVSEPSCTGIDNVSIGGVLFDTQTNYTDIGIKAVQVAEDFQGVEFDWDFSELLNFCEIEVETSNPSDDFGYILFNASEDIYNKTIWFDRLNNSNQVCIKDTPGIASVNEFSDDCDAVDEVLASCSALGIITSGYNCKITENQFEVWPLNHSAILEVTGGVVQACAADWNCTEWSNITDQCGTQNCSDLTDCEIDKIVNQTCGQLCVPSWSHSGWGECVDGFKHKTYYYTSDCEGGIPDDETWKCEYKKPMIVIILVIVGVLLLLLGIMYFIKKKKAQEEGQVPVFSSQTSPSPPATPQTVQPIPKLPARPVQ